MPDLPEFEQFLETFFPEKQADIEAINLAMVAFIFADNLFKSIPEEEGEKHDFQELFTKFDTLLGSVLQQRSSNAKSITQALTHFAQAVDAITPHHLKDRMTGYSFLGTYFLQSVEESAHKGIKTLEIDPQAVKRLVTQYQKQRATA